ncbi:MAG: CvpA family protein [Rhodothermales bacterium]|nr:CvpA family protein [Rhodothermales bacterium]MBO6781449.1 CvpA family protein [Rhodothermales bacterium]
MSILDLIILAILAVGVLHGYRTGFFKQAGGIAGILIGFALGVALMQPAGDYLVRISGMEPALGPVAGFISVFAATYLLVQIAAAVGEKALGAVKLTMLNRVLGGGIGGIKAGLFMSVAFIGMAYVQLPPETSRDNSTLYHSVAAIMPTAWSYVSANSGALDELSRRIEDQIPAEEASN